MWREGAPCRRINSRRVTARAYAVKGTVAYTKIRTVYVAEMRGYSGSGTSSQINRARMSASVSLILGR